MTQQQSKHTKWKVVNNTSDTQDPQMMYAYRS